MVKKINYPKSLREDKMAEVDGEFSAPDRDPLDAAHLQTKPNQIYHFNSAVHF